MLKEGQERASQTAFVAALLVGRNYDEDARVPEMGGVIDQVGTGLVAINLDYLDEDAIVGVRKIETFAEAGVETDDMGVVFVLGDGRRFKITVSYF